jgi:hypothetical protein
LTLRLKDVVRLEIVEVVTRVGHVKYANDHDFDRLWGIGGKRDA